MTDIQEHETIWFPGIYPGRESEPWTLLASNFTDERLVELVQQRATEDGEWAIANGHVGDNEDKMRAMMAWVSNPEHIRQCATMNIEYGVTVDWVCRDLANASKTIFANFGEETEKTEAPAEEPETEAPAALDDWGDQERMIGEQLAQQEDYEAPDNEALAAFLVMYAPRIEGASALANVNAEGLEELLKNPVARMVALRHHKRFWQEMRLRFRKLERGQLQCAHLLPSGKQCTNWNMPGSFQCTEHQDEE